MGNYNREQHINYSTIKYHVHITLHQFIDTTS